MERAALRQLVLATGCAEECGGFVFLCDPNWSAAQRAQVTALQAGVARRRASVRSGWLCVPTGGTSGGVKFARHDERTLSAAVDGFCRHFRLKRVNAVGVLPAHHVSGLMARVRCAATGGRHVAWSWKKLEAGDLPALGRGPWVISLVPTQLHRLLQAARTTAWLRKFDIVFLGGGPVWPALAEQAATAGVRVSLSYGMTETAAMVSALRPAEFLAGMRTCGRVLPHVRMAIGRGGGVRVTGASVFRGYFPAHRASRMVLTEDLGRIDARGHLHVLGRRDAVIITGGKKVHPLDVESTLRASGEFDDIAVIGVPDAEWGEAVVACYPRGGTTPDLPRAVAALASHQRPKRFVAIRTWPRNAQGKLNRAALTEAVLAERG